MTISKQSKTKSGHRYPGSHPFEDNEVDRRLFFGRERDKMSFLYKVNANRLVILYARSGLGKTSLINAGLKQALRDKGYVPLMIRLNNPDIAPIESIYRGIKQIVEQEQMDYEQGKENTLWEYFKTVAFWRPGNKLGVPVLILDQFEEFFMLQPHENRRSFIKQMADLVNNNIPDEVLKATKSEAIFPYSDRPPNVKIIISIREDYLGYLDEMLAEIPGILNNRLRLLPLDAEQASEAIKKPAQADHESIGGVPFSFREETVKKILDFLCRRNDMCEWKKPDEVESFELQLLCSHIEERIVPEKTKSGEGDIIIIEPADLGDDKEMGRVLERFYEDLLDQFDPGDSREQIRRLCEVGLISDSGLRLRKLQEEIKSDFNVSEGELAQLIDYRLIRSEPWGNSISYELSHDTLVDPIREFQKKQKNQIEGILELGELYYGRSEYKNAIEIYSRALERGIKNSLIYSNLGRAYVGAGKTEEAIKNYEEAIRVDPKSAKTYEELGKIYYNNDNFNKAIEKYIETLNIEAGNPGVYEKLSLSYIKNGDPVKAVDIYRQALNADPEYVYIYENIADALIEKGKKDLVEEIYGYAFRSDSKRTSLYLNLGDQYYKIKNYKAAAAAFQKALDLDPENISTKINLAENCFLAKEFEKAYALGKELSTTTNIPAAEKLAAYFIAVSSLLFLGNKNEADAQLKIMDDFRESLHGNYEKSWNYQEIENFIQGNDKIPGTDTDRLLQYIRVPKPTKNDR